MQKFLYTLLIGVFALGTAISCWAKKEAQDSFQINSPNGELSLHVQVADTLRWSASYKGVTIIEPGVIDLLVDEGRSLMTNAQVAKAEALEIDQIVHPPVPQKASSIRENWRGLKLTFTNGFGLELRVFNDGLAYRIVGEGEGELLVQNEVMELNLPDGTRSLFPEEEGMISHNERLYVDTQVSEISELRFASLPIYFEKAGVNIVFTESDLSEYPAMYMFGTNSSRLVASFPGYVTKATPMSGSEDRNEVLEMADYIAVTQKNRTFPWRLAVISDRDGALVESDLVYLLARENKIEDTSWIKPGKVAWDWYNANNLYGVDFRAGINTETYKYYIDFASKFGLEYVILDEGWSRTTTNVHESNPDIDVQELVAYGKKKDVGIILWSLWKPLDKDYKNLLELFASWGVVGVKVDFMQRSDQYMVGYYEKIAKEAAKNKLLVDYHGAFKPTGLSRTYPNVVSYEGVKGSENNKWSKDITPEHNVTLPFIRMVAGPMDYTPGAMVNALESNHHVSFLRPMSLGTRAHQVAMYAVYESPLQMLCDSPSNYLKEPAVTSFIARFPSVWDETRVLAADVGNYILVARRSGKTWYLGAMTDWDARELEVDFSFLDKGNYKIEYLEDGINADQHAEDYALRKGKVNNKSKMKIRLAGGGGWAAIIHK